jgi:hypothetical protein
MAPSKYSKTSGKPKRIKPSAKGKTAASLKPAGIVKSSLRPAPAKSSIAARASTPGMKTCSKAVRFATSLASTVYFSAESVVPSSVPPRAPKEPSSMIFYLENDQMAILKDCHASTKDPHHFDWSWIAAHFTRAGPGQRGPKGAIKVIVRMPKDLMFLKWPGEITVVNKEECDKRDEDKDGGEKGMHGEMVGEQDDSELSDIDSEIFEGVDWL